MIRKILKSLFLIGGLAFVVGLSAYLTLTWIVKSKKEVIVPDLIAKDVVHALEICGQSGLNLKVTDREYSDKIPKNNIIFQELEPGVKVKTGRDIKVILSQGSQILFMPDFKGITLGQARIIMEGEGLCEAAVSYTFDDVPENEIIAHTPRAGQKVLRSECINILVSQGIRKKALKMPDLSGLFLEKALITLEKLNIEVKTIESFYDRKKPPNTIIEHTPVFGSRILEGDGISLKVNKKNSEESAGKLIEGNLFRYKAGSGYLNQRIRLELATFGTDFDYFDGFLKPGEEIWLLLPKNDDSTIRLYENYKIKEIKDYSPW
ncbi:PASTA domain-containing protein [Desulfobacterales bacterium HSG16]|nr:PASTA domain-containing protein [Desulfobacterales bacterium HSG16]